MAADTAPGKIPDLLGPWQNLNRFKLAPAPGAALKPVDDLAGYHHMDRGVDANGQDFSGNWYVGDYTNPILSAAGSAILKKNAEAAEKDRGCEQHAHPAHRSLSLLGACWEPGSSGQAGTLGIP